jgi:hypothetical protein
VLEERPFLVQQSVVRPRQLLTGFRPGEHNSRSATLERCDAKATLVRSVAPLVREANACAKDLVILRESDVGSSLDIIHSIFFDSNSNSSHCGRQKRVSPSNERRRLVVGRYKWSVLSDYSESLRISRSSGIPVTMTNPINRSFRPFVDSDSDR